MLTTKGKMNELNPNWVLRTMWTSTKHPLKDQGFPMAHSESLDLHIGHLLDLIFFSQSCQDKRLEKKLK